LPGTSTLAYFKKFVNCSVFVLLVVFSQGGKRASLFLGMSSSILFLIDKLFCFFIKIKFSKKCIFAATINQLTIYVGLEIIKMACL
jgi:hypothetical protein